MVRCTLITLFAAALTLGGCGDDGAGGASTSSTGEPASSTSGDSPTGATATGPETDASTSGGTMAASATEGATTGVPTSSTTSGTSSSGEGTSSSSDGTSSGGSTSSGSEGTGTSTGDGSSGEESSEGSSSGVVPVNLLKNPSVEDWMMAMVPNTTPDEWTNCSNGGIGVDAVPDSCMASPVVGTDGARYARAYPGEGIGQTIPTLAGHVYAISFDYTAVDMCFGGPPSASFEVLVDGQLLMATPGNAVPMWLAADMQFMAAGDATELCFRKLNDGGQGGLDNLAVFDQG